MRYQGSEAYNMEAPERRARRQERAARPSFEVVTGGGLDARARQGVLVPVRGVRAPGPSCRGAARGARPRARDPHPPRPWGFSSRTRPSRARSPRRRPSARTSASSAPVLSSNARISRIATQKLRHAPPHRSRERHRGASDAEGAQDSAAAPSDGKLRRPPGHRRAGRHGLDWAREQKRTTEPLQAAELSGGLERRGLSCALPRPRLPAGRVGQRRLGPGLLGHAPRPSRGLWRGGCPPGLAAGGGRRQPRLPGGEPAHQRHSPPRQARHHLRPQRQRPRPERGVQDRVRQPLGDRRPLGVAEVLAEALGGKKSDYMELITKNRESTFVYVQRQVDEEVADALSKTLTDRELAGVYFLADTKRVYPYGNVGRPDPGLRPTWTGTAASGLEYYYNDLLTGIDGQMLVETGLYGTPIAGGASRVTEAVDGIDIVISLDIDLQEACESIIAKAVEHYTSDSGSVMVTDPKTVRFSPRAPRRCRTSPTSRTWRRSTSSSSPAPSSRAPSSRSSPPPLASRGGSSRPTPSTPSPPP